MSLKSKLEKLSIFLEVRIAKFFSDETCASSFNRHVLFLTNDTSLSFNKELFNLKEDMKNGIRY